MTVVGSPYGDKGTVFNLPDTSVERPCEGECTVLTQQAGLEFVNGECILFLGLEGAGRRDRWFSKGG